MIITRSPLRITLGGGGTDLPSYYREHEGFLIAAAIDKYVYITVHDSFQQELILKYSQMERVTAIKDVQHPIIREALQLAALPRYWLEITSMADIPSGTGLGSSGSFTTALLKALHTYSGHFIHPEQLAEEACHIEIDRLGDPVGKQDQYIAAYGGITCFHFGRDGKVKAEPLKLSEETRYSLEDNLMLFYTGQSRSAASILADQNTKTQNADKAMLENLHFVRALGLQSKEALETGNLGRFGQILHEHWEYKRQRSAGMSNPFIDECYQHARDNGAIGGKLIGAGGGGFLMFYTEDKMRLRAAMREKNLREVRFCLGAEGTKVMSS